MFRRLKAAAKESVCEDPILSVTDEARRELLTVRAEDPNAPELALWVEVIGVDGGEFSHNMYFDLLRGARPDDVVLHQDDLSVVIPADSVDKIRGSKITLAGGFGEGGWAIENPNKPSPAVGSPPTPAVGARAGGALTGEVAERVAQILDLHINPSIAVHGGRADLVAVEDDTVYVRMSGGCQGCGMAKVTLGQGIEVAIKEAVPEVSRVVDVTDHAAGTSPYFEPAKS